MEQLLSRVQSQLDKLLNKREKMFCGGHRKWLKNVLQNID